VAVSANVSITGERAGEEVVQLYIGHPDATVPRPIRELMGFKRIHLRPGESRRVTFTLHSHQLGYHDEEIHYAVHPGRVEVSLGRSSHDLRLAGHVEIAGQGTRVDRVFFSRATVQ
jgi:hypothetical protein